MQIHNVRVNVHLVLPLKLGPHASELLLGTACRLDVVHDIDVDVVEDYAGRLGRSGRRLGVLVLRFVDDVAKDDAGLGRGDFDCCLDALEGVGAQGVARGTLDQLEVAERCEFDAQVLERLRGLVDDEDVEQDVELLYVDVGFGVDGV